MKYVPVIGASGKALMPCHPARARQLVKKGRARRKFDRGLFYIQLLDREDGALQAIAVGIDPGSKKEALTVKSTAHTYLNIQADAVTWVKEAEATSTTMRRGRRNRKTPYRPMRVNRRQGQFKLPPSTRARWGWKLRLCRWLARYYPVSRFVVEDVAATTKPGKQRWNQSFSPLEVGKRWFYTELSILAPVETRQGYETKALRDELGLKSPSRSSRTSLRRTAWIAGCWRMGKSVVIPHPIIRPYSISYRCISIVANCTVCSLTRVIFASPMVEPSAWALSVAHGLDTPDTAFVMSVARPKAASAFTTCTLDSVCAKTLSHKT